MQETKCSQAGQFNLDGYFTYELVRSNAEGGGVAISALKELQPVFVSDGGDTVEALTIDIHSRNMAISVTSAYGPQESANIERKLAFWEYLSQEAQKAKTFGKGYILQGDLNAWLGHKYLPGDLHQQNRNGKMFANFIKENKLICVNSLPLTKGLITRSRKCEKEVKQSTIDFYVVCERVLPYVKSMKIDNGKVHMLTNYSNVDKEGRAINSDHFPMSMEINLTSAPVKKNYYYLLYFNLTLNVD